MQYIKCYRMTSMALFIFVCKVRAQLSLPPNLHKKKADVSWLRKSTHVRCASFTHHLFNFTSINHIKRIYPTVLFLHNNSAASTPIFRQPSVEQQRTNSPRGNLQCIVSRNTSPWLIGDAISSHSWEPK